MISDFVIGELTIIGTLIVRYLFLLKIFLNVVILDIAYWIKSEILLI
jgi:hypothetical protein